MDGILPVIFSILVGPIFLAVVAGWLGGEADAGDTRQAVAWSQVPVAAATVCWIGLIAMFGWGTFSPAPPVDSPWRAADYVLRGVMQVASVWSLVLAVATLAEVQRFSVGRAIATHVIVGIPLLALMVLLGLKG